MPPERLKDRFELLKGINDSMPDLEKALKSYAIDEYYAKALDLVLSGKARTATVTAASRCELLELDRPTLDGIAARHPHVMQVLQEFSAQRAGSKDEEMVRRMSFGGPK